MLRFVHSGDFHLSSSFEHCSYPSKIAQVRRSDIWESVEKLIEKTKELKADLLLLCGDIFNEEYFTVSHMKRLMDLLSTLDNTMVLIATGNHDPKRENSRWNDIELPNNVYVFDTDKLDKISVGDTDIYGISYKDSVNNYDIYSESIELDKSKNNILMMHTDILNKNERYLPIVNYKSFFDNFDYVALGHIHKPTIIAGNIVYPGSIEPLDFSEQGARGAVFGTIDNGKLKMEFLDISVSRFAEDEYEFSDNFNYYEFRDYIITNWGSSPNKIYLRLVLKGSIPQEYEIDVEELERDLMNYVYYVEIIDRLEDPLSFDKILELNQTNVVGIFIQKMIEDGIEDEVNKKALHLGLRALLMNGD